jgi:hypothetical protein
MVKNGAVRKKVMNGSGEYLYPHSFARQQPETDGEGCAGYDDHRHPLLVP